MTSHPHSTTASPDSAGACEGADARILALVNAARRGDQLAWSRLVTRFDPMLRKVARSYRLAPMDVDDVVQGTWALLYAHIGRIREPAAVGGWLATTVRRQALRHMQSHTRELLTDDVDLGPAPDDTPETRALDAERHDVFMRALRTLPARQRLVVTLLAAEPVLGYDEVGSLLAMPIGSIGPTRARGLASLERNAELRALAA
jgi:RNA polymerase sigma factor (sigma-70 family)